ncbi:hypothetical protein PsorP6_002870 [Peronosclerospora sorghi]|uniref:Uncharacterized protein n=1 Tax=Peronosclerospora sorghi TaxID=230839 RepID=A0ACC0VPY0_9STRA|nr:hypothetical protein PsorP6_002870 [Peronosclerospora sorghi]
MKSTFKRFQDRGKLLKPLLTKKDGSRATLEDIFHDEKLNLVVAAFDKKKKPGTSLAQMLLQRFDEREVVHALIGAVKAKELKQRVVEDLMKEQFRQWEKKGADDLEVFNILMRPEGPNHPIDIFGGKMRLLTEYIRFRNHGVRDIMRESNTLAKGLGGKHVFLSRIATNFFSQPEAQKFEQDLYKLLVVEGTERTPVGNLFKYGEMGAMGVDVLNSPVFDMLERFLVRFLNSRLAPGQKKLPFEPHLVTRVDALRNGMDEDRYVAVLISKGVSARDETIQGIAIKLEDEFIRQLHREKDTDFVERFEEQAYSIFKKEDKDNEFMTQFLDRFHNFNKKNKKS